MERRLAAIMAADVVGYSRLMEADEEGTHARLKALREQFFDPTVAKHNGRIVKLTGDGALVEFPSVVQAAQCGIDIQCGMTERNADLAQAERIVLRIGINLGDVMIEADDIYGGGVNVAARLEGLAEPGGILISGTAYDQVEGRIDCGFAFLGEKEVKNIERPVRVYRVLPDGTAQVPATPIPGSGRRWWAGLAAAVLVLAAIGAPPWLRLGEHDVQSTAAVVEEAPLDPHRIPVLPFVNISADASNEYFSDGITEELITQLSKIGQLSVIARTSVMPYKDSDKGIIDIGRELNVGTILEGSVRKAGDQLRIAAQLIDVTSQAHLWAETYDRGIAGIFAIQSDIAGEVAKNLQLKLGAEDQRASTTNTEAYNMYLKALFLYEQGSSDNVLRSVELLKQAVELDTQFGAAYAALADFCNSLPWFSNIAPAEAQRQAKEYANKALAIDEHLARAHVALAEAKMSSDLDWVGAEVEYKRAIALNPSLARARQRYGHRFLLAAMRRDDEALAEVSRAVELDPLSLAALGSRGWVHYHRREYDQAVEWFQKGLELAPDDPWGYIGIGQSLISEGMYEDGIAELKKGLDAAPGLDFLLGYLAWGYGRSGMIEEAENFVAQLKAAAKTKDIAPMAFAWAYTGMGEKDQAIDWLEKAYAERDGAIIFLRVPEFSDVLGDEPRYHALLRKMGLET